MTPGFLKGKRVLIKSINELGTVVSHHSDGNDEPVIVAIRDSDGKRHCCRIFELVPQLDDGELFKQYCEVLNVLGALVPMVQNIMLHYEHSMPSNDRTSRNLILKMAEDVLLKYVPEKVTVEAAGE